MRSPVLLPFVGVAALYAAAQQPLISAPPAADAAAQATLTPAQFAAQADALVSAEAGRGAFSGTVLLARDGKVVLEKAYGLASREFQVPNRPETRFNLGSINKVFTRIAIAQLAAEGKVGF
ncbi:MAG TPA: serine hydrolase domain-containing protein, partial [Holophagaceae bacterium]|nr:serine hydrolase domain-containing protein [Holophagaceae bacterium]